MKKFLRDLIVFGPFVLVVYIFLLILWGTSVPKVLNKNLNYALGAYGHMFSRIKDVKQLKDVDILFLGSSHAYRGFDTRVFLKEGYKSFNLGSSGQTPVQTELLIKRYFENLNPKLVVIEIYPGMFNNDGVESLLDIMCNDKIRSDLVKMTFDINNIKTYNTFVYSYYRQFFNLDASFNEQITKGYDTYIKSGGYVERKYQRCETCASAKFPATNWEFKDQQKDSFLSLINFLKEKRVEIIFVWAPITKAMYKSVKNKSEIDSFFSKIGTYYNFNELIQLDDKLDFYDAHHLNQKGVENFNKAFFEKCFQDK